MGHCGALGAHPTILRIFYRIILRSIYYCNIRFPYRINKVVRNITINILGHGGKKLGERWTCKGYMRCVEM